MRSSTIRTILLVIVSVLVGYFFGVYQVKLAWTTYHPQISIINKNPPAGTMQLDMTRFWQVVDDLQTSYYDKSVLKPDAMVNGAITGLVNSLGDPFTMYLPPTQNTAFQQQISGTFGGIGAELTVSNNKVTIMSVLDGTPAQKVGLKGGDVIVGVNDKTVDPSNLQGVVAQIQGPKGTQVTLNMLKKGASTISNVTITRDTITVKSVASWVKEVKDIPNIDQKADSLSSHATDKIAYIRLSQFGEQSDQEWTTAVNQIALQISQDKTIKGVVFDLRENPGGLLTDAVYIASEFIPSGVVVQQDDNHGDVQQLDVNRKGSLTKVPLVVLVDGGSASAAEIVSGALRDHNRAKLVGEKTFGKGTVQDAVDLGGGAGLHITIAKWLTPNGTWVHHVGLTPDYVVALDPKNPTHDTQMEKAVEVLLGE